MKILGLSLLIVALLWMPGEAWSQNNEIVNEDYFAAGEQVTVTGTINGDAYIAGGNVLIEGTINGSLLVAGGAITIRGTVNRDVRVVGGQLIVDGRVNGNVSIAGGSATLTRGSDIRGSLAAAVGSLEVLGPIARGVNLAAGRVFLGNTISGNVRAAVGELELGPEAEITGNLEYWSDREADINEGAVVSGSVNRRMPPARPVPEVRGENQAKLIPIMLLFKLLRLLAAFIIGLLLLRLFPSYAQNSIEVIEKRPWLSLGVSLITLILFPAVFLVLVLGVVTIPLALLSLVTLAVMSYFSGIIVSLLAGQKLVRTGGTGRTVSALAVGLLIYGIATSIPVAGWLISFITLTLGLGAQLVWVSRELASLKNEENKKSI